MSFVILAVCLCLLVSCGCASPAPRATDDEIRTISSQIWDADVNRITGSDVEYNIYGPTLFTYVNESRFVGNTFELMLELRNNYTPDVTMDESCGQSCTNEEDAFLDEIMKTDAIDLLHRWLVDQGLAAADKNSFKDALRQYWFMRYTRGGGPLGSSGFEHVFVGEIKNNEVSGMHNWVNFYFEEQDGHFVYGAYQNLCAPEILKFSATWLGYPKAVTSTFMRASPETEIAIYTLCLLTRIGGNCPVRLDGNQLTITVWDMADIPLTIGTAYPNC